MKDINSRKLQNCKIPLSNYNQHAVNSSSQLHPFVGECKRKSFPNPYFHRWMRKSISFRATSDSLPTGAHPSLSYWQWDLFGIEQSGNEFCSDASISSIKRRRFPWRENTHSLPSPCNSIILTHHQKQASKKKSSPVVGGVVRSFRTRKQQPNGPTFVINIKSLYQFSSLPPPPKSSKRFAKSFLFCTSPLGPPHTTNLASFQKEKFQPPKPHCWDSRTWISQ